MIPDYIWKKYNLRIINPDAARESDPLDYPQAESRVALSDEATLITTASRITTTEGTAAPVPPEAQVPPPEFSPSRFIVRFKSDWPHGLENCAQKIFTRGEAFKDYLS